MSDLSTESLPFLSSQERLQAYNIILQGCQHIWGRVDTGRKTTVKGKEVAVMERKFQEDKAKAVLEQLVPLTKNDPYFLAHLTSYAMKNLKSNKDLLVFLTYAATLSSADGTPFSAGSKYMKPNLRYVGAAALHQLEPKLVDRVVKVANMKYGIKGYLNEAQHKPTALRTAIEKYLEFMNQNPQRAAGIQKAGLGKVLKRIYTAMNVKPSEEVVKVLRWRRKDIKVEFDARAYDFAKKTDLEIAEEIRREKIPYLGTVGELARVGKKVSPVIAVAMLEQATGNQAVIMRSTFEDAGILSDPDVMKLYTEKIAEAKSTLDRVENISKDASAAVKQALSQARATSRQSQMAGMGKIFLHIDDSGSMQSARQTAIDKGAILAELVNDPKNNFQWGIFGSSGHMVPLPDEFVRDAFAAKIFNMRDGGSTDCFALYPNARRFGADVDVMITDQGHTDGNLEQKIRMYHEVNLTQPKPRVCVIVNVGQRYGVSDRVKKAYENNSIPVVELTPEMLSSSASVTDAVRTALLGPVAVIDDIMNTQLVKLPEYYYAI